MTSRRASRDDLPEIIRLLAVAENGRDREQAGGYVAESYWRAFEVIYADRRKLLVVGADGVGGPTVATMQISFIPNLTYAGGERAQTG